MRNIKILKEKIARLNAEIKKIEAEKQAAAGRITLSIFHTAADIENAEKIAEFKSKISEVLNNDSI